MYAQTPKLPTILCVTSASPCTQQSLEEGVGLLRCAEHEPEKVHDHSTVEARLSKQL